MQRIKLISTLCILFSLFSCQKQIFVVHDDETSCDLLQVLEKEGFAVKTFSTTEEALEAAKANSALAILADGYPDKGTHLTPEDVKLIHQKGLKVFIEYPEVLGQAVKTGNRTLDLERIVVCDSIAERLGKMSLMTFNRCVINELDLPIEDTLLVAAKVAGFDYAYYGLDHTPVHPILYKADDQIMVSGTRLSNFASYAYRPEIKTKALFEYLISWLESSPVHFKTWPSYVNPRYGKEGRLPSDAATNCVRKGVEWYYNGHMLVDASWKADWVDKYMGDGTMPVGPGLPDSLTNGDGSLGVIEGHMSGIDCKGRQMYRYWMRDDVQGESAYAFATAGKMLENEEFMKVSANLIDFSFDEFRDGPRNDPQSPTYGLLGWAQTHKYVYYGDDNARSLLGTMGATALLNDTKWDQKIVEGIIGNFRTTGVNGFREGRLEDGDIQEKGWQWYYNRDIINAHPHFEAWNWACYLWLYAQTAYAPLLERVEKGVSIMMDRYPSGWAWTNGIQQERARMLLPLAWLYRVAPSEQHLEWLDFMTNELLENQVECGGIREELGDASKGSFGRTPSNAAYGRTEAPLIFENGDPIADMLYTTNFAFVGLCEAAAATQNPEYQKALKKMEDFLIRIQVSSDKFKSLDGAWFRSFNFEDWNYWASNADAGWGAWSTLTGWIQSWIVGTIGRTETGTSLWEVVDQKDVKEIGKQVIDRMIVSQLPETEPLQE